MADLILRHGPGVEAIFARVRCRRIGGASSLFAVGCDPASIKAMGRWWSGAYLLYIRSLQGNASDLMIKACSYKGEYLPDCPDDEAEGDEQ